MSIRGNQLSIAGSDERQVQKARVVFSTLYDLALEGTILSEIIVDSACRFAQGETCSALDLTTFYSSHQKGLQTRKKNVFPRTPQQLAYLNALYKKDLVFGIGPAGTGKTYLAVAQGVHLFLQKKVSRLILSRPAVEAGERLGFLPGDLKEKIDPYLQPLYDALHDMMPKDMLIKCMESGEIEIAPLAFMRGRTLKDAYIILDEAQNASLGQLKMFLTRLGENARMVVTGDLTQVDLPSSVPSGLLPTLDRLRPIHDIGIITFSKADVLRHPLVAKIIQAFDDKPS